MAMLAWLGLLAGAVLAADPLAGAAWIRDERFQGHEVLGVFEAHQKKAKSTILQNIHSYFRKEFELSEEPARAQLCFSADDYAKLYVNGRFVVQGPEPSYPFAQPFCQIDVTGAPAQAAIAWQRMPITTAWPVGRSILPTTAAG